MVERIVPGPFPKKSKLSISLNKQSETLYSFLFLSSNRGLTKDIPKNIETMALTTYFYLFVRFFGWMKIATKKIVKNH